MREIISVANFIIFFGIAAIASWLMGKTALGLLPAGKGRIRKYFPFILFLSAIQLPCWIGDENPLIFLPFFVGVFLYCCGGDKFARLVVGVVLYSIVIPFYMLLDTSGFWGGVLDAEGTVGVLIKSGAYMLIWALVRKIKPEGKHLDLPRRLWVMCGLLSLSPLIAALSFSIWGMRNLEMRFEAFSIRIAYTTIPFAILSSIAVLIALVVLSRHEELEQANQLAEMREMYYQSIKREQTQVRTLRHDMNNHMTVLQGMLERRDVAGAEKYLRELTEKSLNTGKTRHFCENETVNIVLSGKAETMEQKGLTGDFQVSVPAELSVSAVDLCALIGNALDNAIEGAERAAELEATTGYEAIKAAQEEKKIVVFRMRADKGMLMLKVVNSLTDGQNNMSKFAGLHRLSDGNGLIDRAGVLKTSKADKKAHGFGLNGMAEIARRYGGTLDVCAESEKFELIVCLPLFQRKN